MKIEAQQEYGTVKIILHSVVVLYGVLALIIYAIMRLDKLSFIWPLGIGGINFLALGIAIGRIKDFKGKVKKILTIILTILLIANTVHSINAIGLNLRNGPIDRKIYISPMYSNGIVIEKSRTFNGHSFIYIYKVEWVILKREIGRDMGGDAANVNWINEEIAEVKINGYSNYINLNQ